MPTCTGTATTCQHAQVQQQGSAEKGAHGTVKRTVKRQPNLHKGAPAPGLHAKTASLGPHRPLILPLAVSHGRLIDGTHDPVVKEHLQNKRILAVFRKPVAQHLVWGILQPLARFPRFLAMSPPRCALVVTGVGIRQRGHRSARVVGGRFARSAARATCKRYFQRPFLNRPAWRFTRPLRLYRVKATPISSQRLQSKH